MANFEQTRQFDTADQCVAGATARMPLCSIAMRKLVMSLLVCSGVFESVACQGDEPPGAVAAGSTANHHGRVPQVAPPLDVAKPPPDAMKTPSGLAYKMLVAVPSGVQPERNQRVLVRYTGWARNGETLFTNAGGGQPIAIDLAHAAPVFTEVLPMLHQGEKAMLWMPTGSAIPGVAAYEVEVTGVVAPLATAGRTPEARPTAAASATPR